jgi:hypothetical protein
VWRRKGQVGEERLLSLGFVSLSQEVKKFRSERIRRVEVRAQIGWLDYAVILDVE